MRSDHVARRHHTVLALSTWFVLAACQDTVCPHGVRKVGGKCIVDGAMRDAMVDGRDASERDADGGVARRPRRDAATRTAREGGETLSDDAGAMAGNGHDSGLDDSGIPFADPCAVPPDARPAQCMSIPAAPIVDGEPSAGHVDVRWTWSMPSATSTFQVRVDGGPVVEVDGGTTRWEQTFASGSNTLEVRACNAAGCSTYTSFSTTVEVLGHMPAPWLGVAKADFARSPLGHVAPLACRDCFVGSDGAVLDATSALAKISTALTRKADVIELDVADIAGTLHASQMDLAAPATRPLLSALIADEKIASAQALVSLEIVEGDLTPAAFATALLDLLDANRSVIKNGRPLLIKGLDGQLPYLKAIKSAASSYPFIAPYLRYWVDYASRSKIADWQTEIETEVVANGLHGVSFAHQSQNLFGAIGYALSKGLGVGLFDVPGPGFGEVVIAGMREDVDLIATGYRVDQARALVSATTCAGYLNARTLTGVGDPLIIRRNTTGAASNQTQTLGEAETATSYGEPAWYAFGLGQDLVGGVLNFGAGTRALVLSDLDPNPDGGVLVTAVVNLPDPNGLDEGEVQTLVASTDNAGFGLVLANPADAVPVLRFSVRVGSAYYNHDYPVAGGNALSCSAGASGVFTAPLNGGDSYVLTAHYDGTRGPFLFINHQCAGAAPAAVSGGIVASEAPTLLGADPQPNSVPNARSYFRGHVQQAQLQLWGPHVGQELN